jgi:hypothetical protein
VEDELPLYWRAKFASHLYDKDKASSYDFFDCKIQKSNQSVDFKFRELCSKCVNTWHFEVSGVRCKQYSSGGVSCAVEANSMIRNDKWYSYPRVLVLIAFGVVVLETENLGFLFDMGIAPSSSTLDWLSEQPTFLGQGHLHKGRINITMDNSSLIFGLNRSKFVTAISSGHQSSTRQQQPGSTVTAFLSSRSSFCLLTKDDTDVLPEWLAYHYHTMNMRRIIVAVDPDSETSPNQILEKWQSIFGLNHTLWTDQDYMPKDFLNGDFSKVPDYLKGKRSKNGSYWHQDPNVSREQMQKDLQDINSHRYRQRIFLAECYRQLKQEGQQWTVHIDTDEFLTINPLLRKMMTRQNQRMTTISSSRRITDVAIPRQPTAGSLLILWEQIYEHHRNLIGSKTCGLMPSLLFGSRERQYLLPPNTTIPFNKTNFETLRWMYHGEHAPRPKSIVNVALIPYNHKSMTDGRVFDPHIPLFRADKQSDCNRRDIAPFNLTRFEALELQNEKAISTVLSYPLYVNHYLGSLGRFLARNDARRSERIYLEKSRQGDGFQGDRWILSWLSIFVQDHGFKKVSRVFGDFS